MGGSQLGASFGLRGEINCYGKHSWSGKWLASGRATPCFQRTAPGQTHRRKPREKNPSTGCPIPPYHIRNLHRLPQFGAGAETDGIDFPVSIPGLLDANGWLQKVLETVRLAGDALPLFSSQNRRSWKMTKMRGFSPLTRIAHTCIYIYLHTSLFYTAKGLLNASVEGFHKIQSRVIDAGYKIKTSNEDHGR